MFLDSSRYRTASCYLNNHSTRTKYTLSYIHGHDVTPNAPTPQVKTIGQFVDESAEKFPDKDFVVFSESGQRRTFQQIKEKVTKYYETLFFQ